MCLFMFVLLCLLFFCFKQKTAYEMRISDWSSDVCSSDLAGFGEKLDDRAVIAGRGAVGEAAEGDGAAGVEVEPGVAEAGAQPQRPRADAAVDCRMGGIDVPVRAAIGDCQIRLAGAPGDAEHDKIGRAHV